MTINVKANAIISKDTINLVTKLEQEPVWYSAENSMTNCVCYNIHTFDFSTTLDTSKIITITVGGESMSFK